MPPAGSGRRWRPAGRSSGCRVARRRLPTRASPAGGCGRPPATSGQHSTAGRSAASAAAPGSRRPRSSRPLAERDRPRRRRVRGGEHGGRHRGTGPVRRRLRGTGSSRGTAEVNTLDSMVGYRDGRYGRFGWASAHADDVANLVPSRLTALLVDACARSPPERSGRRCCGMRPPTPHRTPESPRRRSRPRRRPPRWDELVPGTSRGAAAARAGRRAPARGGRHRRRCPVLPARHGAAGWSPGARHRGPKTPPGVAMTAASVPPPGPHGDDARRVAAALGLPQGDVLDLATSLNPVAPDAAGVVAAALGSLRSYPDAADATAALAEALGVAPEHVLLTNGGSEAIALVAGELGAGWVDSRISPSTAGICQRCCQVPRDGGRTRTTRAVGWRTPASRPPCGTRPSTRSARGVDVRRCPHRLDRGGLAHEALRLPGTAPRLRAQRGRRARRTLGTPPAAVVGRQPRCCRRTRLARVRRRHDLVETDRHLAPRADCDVLQAAGLHAEPSDANFVLFGARPPVAARPAGTWRGIVVRDCASFDIPEACASQCPPLTAWGHWLRPSRTGAPEIARPAGRRRGGALRRALAQPAIPEWDPSEGAPSWSAGPRVTSARARSSPARRLLAREACPGGAVQGAKHVAQLLRHASGHEIGVPRVQSLAAGQRLEVAMNPILLKPTGERRSQVVVMGRPLAELEAAAYQRLKRDVLWPVVIDAYEDLRSVSTSSCARAPAARPRSTSSTVTSPT